jgi:hypothetical protein
MVRRALPIVTTLLMLASALPRAQDEVSVTCLPDKVLAPSGGTVRVNVWVAMARRPVVDGVAALWKASAGRFDTQTPATQWVLEGAEIDQRQTATVDVSVNGIRIGSCSLGVWSTEPADRSSGARLRGEYITRRAFLRAGQAGEQGFGLYSYFLMREPASAADRARSVSFVTAFLDALVGVADQENYVERRRLNGSYMPVTTDPPPGGTAQQRTAWALDHYDYEHAKALLSLYPALTGRGPFIVAVPAPLRSPVKPMLPWDFSAIDSTAIGDAVSRFLNQAAQLYDWQNESALQKLGEQLMTAAAGMFVGRTAAENWIQVIR